MTKSLLNPDNRLLSWSISDLGLYGAALTPTTVSAVEQRREYSLDESARPARSNDTAPLPTSLETGRAFDVAASGDLSPVYGDASFAPPTSFQPMMLPLPAISAPAISTLPAGAPADVGAGSTAGIFVPAPVPPATPPAAIVADPIDTGTSLSAPVLPTGLVVDTATLTVATIAGQTAASATDAVDVVASTVEETVPPIVDAATETAQSATEALSDTATSLGNAVSDVSTSATQTTDAAVDALTASADGIVAPAVTPVVDALAASGITDTASTLVDAAVTPPTDLLSGVGGTDPAAGVATLVDIVAAADEFDLSHVNDTPVADSGSIIDLLAVDLNEAPLLGVGDDDIDATNDDGAHGLLGLGL